MRMVIAMVLLFILALLASLIVSAGDEPELVPVPREVLEQLVTEHKDVLVELDLYRRALELCKVKSGCV